MQEAKEVGNRYGGGGRKERIFLPFCGYLTKSGVYTVPVTLTSW